MTQLEGEALVSLLPHLFMSDTINTSPFRLRPSKWQHPSCWDEADDWRCATVEPAIKQQTQKQLGSAPFTQLLLWELLWEEQLITCPRSDCNVVGVFEEWEGEGRAFCNGDQPGSCSLSATSWNVYETPPEAHGKGSCH